MGTAARRRPSRECQVGIEGLDTRTVPVILNAFAPGSPLVESGLNATLNVAFDEHGHASASFTRANPVTGVPFTTATLLSSNLGPGGTLTDIPGVTGPGSGNPLTGPNPTTLTYRLPTPVADGDVVVRDFQSGQISDVLRFVTVSDGFQGTRGYMLVYSDGSDGIDSPADVATLPTPTPSILTQNAIEFGVEGFNVIEYAAEQATYSGLSDFNAVPLGTP